MPRRCACCESGAGWSIARGYGATFRAMGVRMLQPSCGAVPIAGRDLLADAQQDTASAINRNFPERSGRGQVWLASPTTVMASALAGELIAWEQLRRRVTPLG